MLLSLCSHSYVIVIVLTLYVIGIVLTLYVIGIVLTLCRL